MSGLDAESVRTGSACTLTLFGQVVYQTSLVQSVGLSAHYLPARIEDAERINILPARVQSQNQQSQASAEVFTEVLKAALSPDASTQAEIATMFRLRPEDTQTYFPITETNFFQDLDLTVEAVGPLINDLLPFNFASPTLLASSQGLDRLVRNRQTHTEELFIQFRPKTVDIFGVVNRADPNKRNGLRATVNFEGSLTDGGRSSLTRLETSYIRPFSDSRTATCFTRRFTALKNFANQQLDFAPTYAETSTPCRTDSLDADEAFFAQAASRRLILATLEDFSNNPRRSPQYYGDWRAQVAAKALRLQRAGEDFAQVLDPASEHPYLGLSARYARQFSSTLSSDLKTLFEQSLLDVALDWSIRGFDNVSNTKFTAVATVVLRYGLNFERSTHSFLESLREGPESQNIVINSALQTSEENLRTVKNVQTKARSYALNDWADGWSDRYLQSPIDPITMTSWETTLNGAQAFVDRDLVRAHRSGELFFLSRREALLMKAINEGWGQNTFDHLEALMPYANVSSRCVAYRDGDYASLTDCIGLTVFSNADGKILHPRNRRSQELAPEFLSHDAHLATITSPRQLRETLQGEFWKPIWKDCDDATYNRKREELSIRLTEDLNRRGDVEVELAIETLLRSRCT